MATFTGTALVSGISPSTADSTPEGIGRAPDIRTISIEGTQQTALASGISVEFTYTETGPILGTYFQLFRCEPVYFGLDKSTEASNPPNCVFRN